MKIFLCCNKYLIIFPLCLILCSCFTHPVPKQYAACLNSEVPVSYPCRMDIEVAKKILNTSGRKNVCDNSNYCNVESDSFIYVVSSVSEDVFGHCIKKWNSKAEVAEKDSLNFVHVSYNYYYNAELDGFSIWKNAWIDVTNLYACYNIKNGVLF